MRNVYILGGLRTPIGKTGGFLKDLLPEDMVSMLIKALIKKYGVNSFDELYLGNAIGTGGNIARLSLLKAGLGFDTPATTIDFQCGSGLKAICIACNKIKSGDADIIIAGGVESTSLRPRRQYNENDSRFRGSDVFYERAQFSPEEIGDPDMITGAENTVELFRLSREEMDQWALRSHKLASRAFHENVLSDVILPVEIGGKKYFKDESIRDQINISILSRAKPVIPGGTITGGNACLTHDGAALVILASEDKIKDFNTSTLVKISHDASAGVDPNYPPIGAAAAVKKLLLKAGIAVEDIDAFEINEAFAAKILTFKKELGVSEDKINIFGGALAYGHPYGASGAIIVLHLMEFMKKRKLKNGVAGIGVAGGQGVAAMLTST